MLYQIRLGGIFMRTKGAKGGIFGNNIDKATFEKLCALMCTEQEIMGFFRVKTDTLLRFIKQEYGADQTFRSIFPILSANGKISLRRNQFELSKTNSSMAIFLGKQWLGQREYVEENVSENIIVNTKVDDPDDSEDAE